MAVSSLGQPLGSTSTVTSGINAPFQPAINQLLQGATAAAAKPYEAYTGERVAGFSPLQQQAMSGIAGLQAFQPTQYTTQSFTTPGVQQQYMSPYQQGVTDIATREAQRQADIAATRRGAQAAGAGAFGGYRQGIENAEAQRNTAQLLNDIQTKGLQSAYGMGMQQFNTEQQRDMARQQAQELANRYGYQTGISALGQQLDVGGMQQADTQRRYDVGYQDYLNRMKYPYEQVNFLRNALSGLPIQSTTTTQSYDKPGAFQQALGGLGAATSLYNMAGGSKGLKDMFGGIGSLFGSPSGIPSASEMSALQTDAMNQLASGVVY